MSGERPIRCAVCRHPDRLAAEEALLRGEGVRQVAARLGISKSVVHTHKQAKHVSEAMVKAADAERVAGADALLRQMQETRREIARLSRKAEHGGDVRGAIVGLQSLGRIDELLAKMTSELNRPGGLPPLDHEDPKDRARRIIELLAKAKAMGQDFGDAASRLLLARRIAENAEFREAVRAMLEAADAGKPDVSVEVLLPPAPPPVVAAGALLPAPAAEEHSALDDEVKGIISSGRPNP